MTRLDEELEAQRRRSTFGIVPLEPADDMLRQPTDEVEVSRRALRGKAYVIGPDEARELGEAKDRLLVILQKLDAAPEIDRAVWRDVFAAYEGLASFESREFLAVSGGAGEGDCSGDEMPVTR